MYDLDNEYQVWMNQDNESCAIAENLGYGDAICVRNVDNPNLRAANS